MTEKIIARGAEAVLILNDAKNLTKKRVEKGYRIKELDEKIRKSRTRRETKLMEKASKLIPTPRVIKSDDKTKEIEMGFVKGKRLSDYLDEMKNAIDICFEIGKNIAKLHDAGIIHGDLTTSNMIYAEDTSNINEVNINNQRKSSNIADKNSPDKKIGIDNNLNINDETSNHQDNTVRVTHNKINKVYFIDFGLGFESNKIEDKAVDLHLIKEALEAKHFKHSDKFFKAVLEGYKTSKNFKEVLKRLEAVERRGRYKQSY